MSESKWRKKTKGNMKRKAKPMKTERGETSEEQSKEQHEDDKKDELEEEQMNRQVETEISPAPSSEKREAAHEIPKPEEGDLNITERWKCSRASEGDQKDEQSAS